MMLYIYTTFIALILVRAIAVHAAEPSCLSESCAQELLDSMNDQYNNGSMPYGDPWPSIYVGYQADFMAQEYYTRGVLVERIALLKNFDWQNFQNPLLKRQFEVLLRELNYPQLEKSFELTKLHMKSLGNTQFVCQRGQKTGDCNKSFNKLTKPDMVKSNDLELIKWNWAEWRNKLPGSIVNDLNYYIHYYQNFSTPALAPSAIWYQNYEDKNFIAELESAMETIKPFYSQMHGHLRQALRLKYGDNVIPASGLIPHHLMEQAFYQSWKKDSVLRNPYPNKKLPNMQQELNSMGVNSFEFVNSSVLTFRSMGFKSITDDFMRTNFREHVYPGPDCKGVITTYPELKMLYCPRNSYKKLLTSNGDIAQFHYEILKREKPLGLNQDACPGFGNAIAEAAILASSSPKHLQKTLGLLLDYNYDEELTLNFLYRMANHALLSIPTYFVHEKLWLDIIDKKITPAEYNCRYWDLMATHMGVGRPSVATNPGAYEMPYKFYEGVVEDVKSTKKLFGELLGYQIFKDICLQIGEYQSGNPDKLLLNCVFANSERAGDLLKGMMSPGSTKHWRELVKSLTQVNTVQGNAFLDYYAPIQTWITKYNADNHIQVGWNPVNTCQRSY